MNKKQQRHYNITDAELCIRSKSLISFIKRDAAQFLDFGITDESTDDYMAAIDAFSELPDDAEITSSQAEATQLKDAAAEALRIAIRNIMGRVQLKFGNRSARYKQFGTSLLSVQTDAELMVT